MTTTTATFQTGPEDPLGAALDGLRMAGGLYFRSAISGAWGVSVPRMERAHFHLIEAGHAVVTLPQGRPVTLGAGDLVLLPRGAEHQMSSSPFVTCTPLARVLELASSRGRSLRIGDPPHTRVFCGYVDVGAGAHHPLMRALPSMIHVQGALDGQPGIGIASLTALVDEALSMRPGASAITTRLCETLFCIAVRDWYERDGPRVRGWLSALADPALSRALIALHRQLRLPWTVDLLARRAALSRAAFARRFLATVGEPPLRYVTRARMLAAADLLRATDANLSAVAEDVGYASVEAFSRGFKREFGKNPSSFRSASRSEQRAAASFRLPVNAETASVP